MSSTMVHEWDRVERPDDIVRWTCNLCGFTLASHGPSPPLDYLDREGRTCGERTVRKVMEE
jgi:hypothetical protein